MLQEGHRLEARIYVSALTGPSLPEATVHSAHCCGELHASHLAVEPEDQDTDLQEAHCSS